ncbi:hypothetical protein BANORC5_19710 [Bacteroides nordii]|nr:hypothetical protein BANORC5_19710 [Bacteroides nordii]
MDYSVICMNDISLRDYQQEAKEKIFSQWNHVDNVMYQMPTGTGKTRLFTSIIRDINVWGLRNNKKQRILIVAHRTELIDQIHNSLNKYHIPHGVIAGNLKRERNLKEAVQVASIQTITSSANRDIADSLNADFIIIDEAHHAVASTYKLLWKFYPEAKKLGVTATPWRMNGCGFSEVFDTLIPSMPISEFMEKGWLSPYQYYSIPSNSSIERSINSIKETDINGDYKTNALEKVLDNDSIRANLLQSYIQLAKGKKGIIYSISRTHSEHICSQYRNIGIKIVNIGSGTPAKIREQYVRDFKEGKIDIIVNIDIFSEGFDCPDIEFVQLARPTKSLVKYIQQVGRGLRKNGDKKCIILDNVGMYNRFGLPDADHPWVLYFEGSEETDKNSSKSSQTKYKDESDSERDLSEGNEQMVLIQNLAIKTVQTAPSTEKNALDKPEEVLDSRTINLKPNKQDIIKQQNTFYIRSAPFISNKYFIEENNEGYFIVNIKTQERLLFLLSEQHKIGSIRLVKEGNNVYTIIRVIPLLNGNKEKQMVIGTLKRVGKLIKITPLIGNDRQEYSFV